MFKTGWLLVKKDKPNYIDLYQIYTSKKDVILNKDEKWRKIVISFYKPVKLK